MYSIYRFLITLVLMSEVQKNRCTKITEKPPLKKMIFGTNTIKKNAYIVGL